MTLRIDVAPGELIDKITILDIKLSRIGDPAKLRNVRHEYETLMRVRLAEIEDTPAIAALQAELKATNEAIWDIEDAIRDHERRGDFGPSFIELARGVYITNDRRSAIKRRINDMLDSPLIEEKSYTPY